MRSKIKQVSVALTALALLLIVASNDVVAQGRGKGRGGDDRGGRQNVERPGPGWDQQRSDKEARRQQAESDRRSRMQQQRSDWESRRQQAESDRRSPTS
ncbi:hypothetical protein [Leptolyngbya sp. 7M]|uniref:hypothetical protein n=1 Tax=Leptolyngbya sp. 7M TaxID=2812896 RepID=UPI001B8C9293|nr:hypothetical protein [Leptolyngbya sp. 7M]QYO63098.1 hypothetical protein JVX88_24470 [Leptolyngbya sp. 7M]